MLKIRNPFLMILLGVSVCLTASGNAFGYIAANGAGNGYCDPGDPTCSGSTGGSTSMIRSSLTAVIESYIEEGGSYFFKAFSEILLLSGRVEAANLDGIDANELQRTVEAGLANIQNAKSAYYILIRTAEMTPYNPVVLTQLKAFAYTDFMLKNSLEGAVFQEVQEYLQNGNITGTFKRLYSKVILMEELLLSIKNETDSARIPSIPTIWRLNEAAADNLLFGQYVARIFAELAE